MDRGAATLINATFTRNTADLAGGALYAWNANKDNNITLLGGMFSQNEARTQWGGAISNWHSHVILNGTSFADNQAAMMGGAVWTDAESLTNLTTCTWHQKLARALPPPQLLRPVPPNNPGLLKLLLLLLLLKLLLPLLSLSFWLTPPLEIWVCDIPNRFSDK